MRLSIVIPVFRVEHTLERCMESILIQTFTDYEIILVDDGSPDASPDLCDRYARKDARISVIHQANAGLSEARNTGIDKAKGTYITFVDSDDYLAPATYQPLMDILQAHPEYDLLEYPVLAHQGSKQERMLALKPHAYTDIRQYWLETRAYTHAYAWNKVYRRELFRNIRYPKGKLFEDVWVMPQLLEKAHRVATTDQGMYIYTHNPDGITSRPDGTILRELLSAHLNHLDRQPIDRHYYAYLLNIQMYVYGHTGDELRLPVLPFYSTPKLFLLHIIGLKKICQLHKIMYRLMGRS